MHSKELARSLVHDSPEVQNKIRAAERAIFKRLKGVKP